MKPRSNKPKTRDTLPNKNIDVESLRTWIVSKISERLKIKPAEVDIKAPLKSYGLDSIEAVSLVGDLEIWLKRRLEPTLLWDYPNVESLARYLAENSKIKEPENKDSKTKPSE